MANYDDIFTDTKTEETDTPETKENVPFDRDAWIEQKQLERENAYSMMAETAEKMGTDGSLFKTYLDVQSQFNRYSVGNALLVTAQNPEATRLADFDTWKKNGGYVIKGENAIVLLEPGEEYAKDDGSVGVSFVTKKVFDISQTSLKDNVQPAQKPSERQVIKALVETSPCQIKISEDVGEQLGAYYDDNFGGILIRQGMDGSDIIKKLSREIAAVRMADSPEGTDISFNSYCVSYIIAKKYGIDVGDYNFDRLSPNITGKDAKSIRTELGQIRDTANDMIGEIYKSLEPQKSVKQRDDAR